LDNDGKPSLIVTALGGETYPLFRNEGNGFSATKVTKQVSDFAA